MGVVLAFSLAAISCAAHSPPPAEAPPQPEDDDVTIPWFIRRSASSVMCETERPAQVHPDGGTYPGGPDGGRPRGGLDKELIRKRIRTHHYEIKSCYVGILKDSPYPKGRVLSRFVIAPSGKVASSCIADSAINSPELLQCLADEILKWRFPKPEGGGCVFVAYPYSFTTDWEDLPKPR